MVRSGIRRAREHRRWPRHVRTALTNASRVADTNRRSFKPDADQGKRCDSDNAVELLGRLRSVLFGVCTPQPFGWRS